MPADIIPGIYDFTEVAYHADPCPTPSLSSSIGKTLIDQSPLHAWTSHPRLNPAFEPEEKETFDLGSAAHAVILGSRHGIVEIEADSYRTNDAKAARAAAREQGMIPVLSHQMAEVSAMAVAAALQLAHHADARHAFSDGIPEQTLAWQEPNGIWCRCRLDWLPNKGRVFTDLKTTGTSANPDLYERTLFNMGYDFQAAFYRRGIRAVLGIEDPVFRFVVVENKQPYGLSVIELGPLALDLADRRVEQAIDYWAWCLDGDRWPCYPARTVRVDVPEYLERKQMEREDRDQTIRETTGQHAREFMNTFHKPLEVSP